MCTFYRAAAAMWKRLKWASILLFLLFSCRIDRLDPFLPPLHTAETGKGSMLVRGGSWLYRLGGGDLDGAASSAVTRALIGEEGQEENWQALAQLPKGLRDSASFSAGNFIYVLGGRNDEGPVDTIYYTYLHPDGTLGFGADNHWESNVRPLPAGRSSAAWALYDGWIFLIGGSVSTIIRARIYQDGQIGQWYPSAETLPEARLGAAAAELNGRLYVAGGSGEQGVVVGVVSFALGSGGALSDRRTEANLPQGLQNPILLADQGDLILAGGFNGETWSSKVYRWHQGVWTEALQESEAEGPWFGQAGGELYFQRSKEALAPGIGMLEGLRLGPEKPVVLPGSGLVPAGSPLLVRKEPGTTLRYRTDGAAPSIQDPLFPDTLFRISLANLPLLKISLAAFGPDGIASEPVFLEYRLRSGNFFVVTEESLPIHDSSYSSLDTYTLKNFSSLWYRMRIEKPGEYRLAWADADQDPMFSARILLSAFEADLYTEVPDQNNAPVFERQSATASPLLLFLGAGDYYLQLRDAENLEGVSFGLSIMEG
jgi:hypothetical protein